jgi:hypothetical protein
MKTLRISLTALMLVAGLAVLGGPVRVAALPAANAIEVSQHTYLTANGEYDRNPSIIHDGTDYWLFWTKANGGGVRGEAGYDPDADTYVVYYKKASTIPGLAGATETKLALSDPGPPYDFDQRVVTAVVANDGTQNCIYAIVSSGFSASHRSHGMYYYKYDGSTWTGPVTMIAHDSANQYGAHVNAVSDGSTIYIVWDNDKSQFFTFDPGTGTLTGPTQISTDNMPKITLMDSTLYVVSIEDGSGDIEVYSSATSPVSWSPHSTAIAGGGMYDPCIFNDGTNLYVVSAPWMATDRQYLVQSKYAGGSWATPKTVSYGGYGNTEWWDYWPIGYHDGTDAYVFFTTETDSPAFSDGEIATVKMDWDLSHDHYFYIQNAVDQAGSGDTVNVAAGTYTEAVTIQPGTDLTIQGAGRDVTTWIAPADDDSRMHCIQCDLQGYTGSTTLDVSGFTFSVEDNEIDNGGIAILVNKARQGPLNLAIHDNKFVETTTIPGETANSMLLCHNRFAARGTDAPVKIYNNLDETAGGIAMSNSRAFDVYDNTFDGGSDALYIGYGCPTNTTVGDHHIYNNTFKNASNVYPDGPWPSILFSYSGSGTGMTFLPSTIEHNFFEDNDVAVGYGMDSDITYPADIIRDNSFEGSNEYALQVWGAYSTTVDASGNWWGTNTPAGVAAEVSANVDYTPWLDSGTDTSGGPGFQGDFSALHVDDDSPQTGSTGYIQEGINMVSGSTVYVAAGTYNERVTINESVDLRGAQYGVDPTAVGARTIPANESIITEAGLSTPNPDVLIEIPNGVTNVKVDGFTLVGDSNNTTADTSTVRAWDDDITVSNNIIDGMYGVLYKGGDTLTVHRNRMVVNKLGVTVQPNPASNVTISENVFNLGSSPVGGESAIYMTSCNQCSATGNTATSFANGNGIGGSNLSQLMVSGNTFTGNKDAVSIWGGSTYITIRDNDLSSSLRYGISVKGQDVTITGNEIKDNGDAGVNIDRHMIDTERVEVHYNNITGNTNYGLKVGTADGIETVNATCNWWGAVDGPSGNGPGSGDAVTGNALFDPWLLGPAPEGPCGGSIYVEKYHDQDKDGQDDAEPRLDGWKITLFDGGWQEVASDYTHDGGQVAFVGLSFGNYYVCEEMQDGWVNSDPGNTCQTAIIGSGAATQGPGSATLTTDGNSYQIDFLGTSNGGLTWSYKVTEVSGKDLSHWVLGLCMGKDAVTGWSPAAGAGIEKVELVYPDPTTHLSGIKWDVKDDYNGDGNDDGDVLEFSFTLDAVYPVGTTEVGIKTGGKDNKTATGFIAGPHCGDGSSEATLVFGNHEEKGTAVTLASFTAESGPGTVALAWETGTEVDNAGFNLYRATAEGGPYAKVNGALIAAEGDPVSGASYSFLDKGLSPGTYYYKLEDVDLTGTTTLHGPVSDAVLPRLRRPTYRPTLP